MTLPFHVFSPCRFHPIPYTHAIEGLLGMLMISIAYTRRIQGQVQGKEEDGLLQGTQTLGTLVFLGSSE
ncbi:hypothetical protein RJT34_16204 [Clitoria ternatea]|uniref:Uncharacterized protein n=1 Tax=Clitoria ternatea TaxID=43366 RepID=A0AAN9J8A3_CLITE